MDHGLGIKRHPHMELDPLSNILAAVHYYLEPRPKRCMISVHQTGLLSIALRPLNKQQGAKDSNRTIRYIVLFTWALLILALTLFTVLDIFPNELPEGIGTSCSPGQK
jgi:hypothetical protein